MNAPISAPFSDLASYSTDVSGGKGWGLAMMSANDFAVAPGFVVTSEAFKAFLATDDLDARLHKILNVIPKDDKAALTKASEELQEMIGSQEFPSEVAQEIARDYAALSQHCEIDNVPVAVRSSANAEDSAASSFAGEFESWIDVSGIDNVLEHVRKCYQSMYYERVLSYMLDRDIDPTTIEMAVVVQKTVRAQASGVMFTLDPRNGDKSSVAIEANWGLGLGVVNGDAIPDRFVINKITGEITDRVLGGKEKVYLVGNIEPADQDPEKSSQFCLNDPEIEQLVDLGTRLERFRGVAQDIEFAIDEDLPDGKNVVLLQCRPETYWTARKKEAKFVADAGMMSWVSQVMSAPDTSATPSGGHTHA